MSNSKVKYRTGDEVAHKDNITFKMRVRAAVFEEKRLSHIVCDWFEEDIKVKDNFHSKELVLWSIAEQGQEFVDSYFKNIENENKYQPE